MPERTGADSWVMFPGEEIFHPKTRETLFRAEKQTFVDVYIHSTGPRQILGLLGPRSDVMSISSKVDNFRYEIPGKDFREVVRKANT